MKSYELRSAYYYKMNGSHSDFLPLTNVAVGDQLGVERDIQNRHPVSAPGASTAAKHLEKIVMCA